MISGIKDNFDPYNVLAIATNIAVLFMTAFVLQGHITCKLKKKETSTDKYTPTQSFFLIIYLYWTKQSKRDSDIRNGEYDQWENNQQPNGE